MIIYMIKLVSLYKVNLFFTKDFIFFFYPYISRYTKSHLLKQWQFLYTVLEYISLGIEMQKYPLFLARLILGIAIPSVISEVSIWMLQMK